MLDAPVSGGEPGAIAGTLSIMVGGDEDVFERCRPMFEAMGKTIVYCGPAGSGQVVKLCNQVIVGLNNLAVCEALVLCVKAGVDPRRMLRRGRRGRGELMGCTEPRAEDARPATSAPGFKVEHQQKDLRHALGTAARDEGAAARNDRSSTSCSRSSKTDGLGAKARRRW